MKRDLKLNGRFWQEVDDVLGSSIEFGVPSLTTEAFDFSYRYALQSDVGDGLSHIVELEGLDNGRNHFHRRILVLVQVKRLADREDQRVLFFADQVLVGV